MLYVRAGVDLADAVVEGVGDEQIAGGVQGNAVGLIEFGGGAARRYPYRPDSRCRRRW